MKIAPGRAPLPARGLGERRVESCRTEAMRYAGVQGTVILMVVFADEGVLKYILVLQGLSHGLTEQAIASARKIRFDPAMTDGKPGP